MMDHPIKITNNVRPDTRDVSLALHDSFETVSCHFDIDATICRTGRESGIEMMPFQDFRGCPFKRVAIKELPVRAFLPQKCLLSLVKGSLSRSLI